MIYHDYLKGETVKNYIIYLLLFVFLGLALLFFSSFALSQGEMVIYPPTEQDWALFFASIKGTKGLASLGGAAVIVQFLLYLFRSDLGILLGKWRLVTVTLLTTISGALMLKITGLDWPSALMHGTTLSAFQVFAHQFYKQFFIKKD